MVDHCIKIMAELKAKENKASGNQFIDAIENSSRKKDCLITKKIMQDITGKRVKIWGDSIVGSGAIIINMPAAGKVISLSPGTHRVSRISPSISCRVLAVISSC
jgi:hypothetical protein